MTPVQVVPWIVGGIVLLAVVAIVATFYDPRKRLYRKRAASPQEVARDE